MSEPITDDELERMKFNRERAVASYRKNFAVMVGDAEAMIEDNRRLIAEVGRLKASCKVFEAMLEGLQWQPIDTAPKDWSSVILFDETHDPKVFEGYYDGVDWKVAERKAPCKPTKWMPMPLPPEKGT